MNFLQLLLTQVSHLQDYLCIKESLLPLLTFITLDLCGLPSLWGESIFRRTIHHVSGGGYTRWRLMGSPPFLIGMKRVISTTRVSDDSNLSSRSRRNIYHYEDSDIDKDQHYKQQQKIMNSTAIPSMNNIAYPSTQKQYDFPKVIQSLLTKKHISIIFRNDGRK